jgi:tRNA(Ile)-lysidine synthase
MASSRNNRCTDGSVIAEPIVTAVDAALRRHVGATHKIVVGLSGGVDSVVLLQILHRLAPSHQLQLAACHVHHGLSRNADAWQQHCAALCATLAVPLSVHPVVVSDQRGEGVEAAARRARYQVFAGLDADWLALAHHRGDQAETMLFNLLRGTGLRGAAAMQEVRRGAVNVLRPLLDQPRSEVLAYAKRHGLKWIDDESNADSRYSRNHLRLEVLPALQRRYPGGEANLAAAARRFGEALGLLDDLARLDLGDRVPGFPLPVSLFKSLSEARGRNLLRFLLAAHGVGIPSEERLTEALRQLLSARIDRHPSILLGQHALYRERGQVHLREIGKS